MKWTKKWKSFINKVIYVFIFKILLIKEKLFLFESLPELELLLVLVILDTKKVLFILDSLYSLPILDSTLEF